MGAIAELVVVIKEKEREREGGRKRDWDYTMKGMK